MAHYKVYFNEVSEISQKLINYSRNDINDKIEELSNLAKEIKWTGPAHDEYMEIYNEKIKELQVLNERICLFGKYLGTAEESYSYTSNKIEKSLNKIIDEMGVKK